MHAMKHPIRKWRSDNDLTLEQAADRLGVTKGYLSKIENGSQWPGEEVLDRIVSTTKIGRDALAKARRKPFHLSVEAESG